MTQAEKGLLRYEIILAKTDQVQGDFANTAGDVANQERIIAARSEDLSAKFGTLLLPAFQKLNRFVGTSVIPAFETLFRIFRDHIIPIIQDRVVPVVLGIFRTFQERLSPSIERLIGLFQGPSGLSGALSFVGQAWAAFQNILGPVVDFIINTVITSLEFVITTLTTLISFITNVFTGNWEGAWGNIEDLFESTWDAILATLENVWNLMVGVFANFGVDIENVLRRGANGVIGIFEGMANGIIGAINGVITAWNDFELKLGGQTLFRGTPFEVDAPVCDDFHAECRHHIPALSGAIIRR